MFWFGFKTIFLFTLTLFKQPSNNNFKKGLHLFEEARYPSSNISLSKIVHSYTISIVILSLLYQKIELNNTWVLHNSFEYIWVFDFCWLIAFVFFSLGCVYLCSHLSCTFDEWVLILDFFIYRVFFSLLVIQIHSSRICKLCSINFHLPYALHYM